MKDLQQAADDVAVIAEMIDELHKMFDRFHAKHGAGLYEELECAWPSAYSMDSTAALYKFERSLIPPDERTEYAS